MPIRPENRDRYPKDWHQISWRIRERAGQCCEECGVENHALGGRLRDGTFLKAYPLGDNGLRLVWPRPGDHAWCGEGERQEHLRIVRIVLTVAHLDHVPENCSDENLRALCQRCHLRHDAKEHARTARRTRHAKAGQRDLFA